MQSSVANQRVLITTGAIAAALLVLIVGLLLMSPLARRFGPLGIEHILTGYDHLAFLVMLLVPAQRLRDLVWIITAFTVAHSITLSAATLGYIVASSTWVEPVIALTILYVAVENLVRPAPTARVALTFGFGLIHGLGFANALSEGPLSPSELLLALFSFNLGVEVGQLAFLAIVYPLWRTLARGTRALPAQRVLSAIVIGLCVFWLWQRL